MHWCWWAFVQTTNKRDLDCQHRYSIPIVLYFLTTKDLYSVYLLAFSYHSVCLFFLSLFFVWIDVWKSSRVKNLMPQSVPLAQLQLFCLHQNTVVILPARFPFVSLVFGVNIFFSRSYHDLLMVLCACAGFHLSITAIKCLAN